MNFVMPAAKPKGHFSKVNYAHGEGSQARGIDESKTYIFVAALCFTISFLVCSKAMIVPLVQAVSYEYNARKAQGMEGKNDCVENFVNK